MSRQPPILDGRTKQYRLISIEDIRLQNSPGADAVLRAVHERTVLHYITNGFGESTVFIDVEALSSLVPAEAVSALVQYAATFPEPEVMRWQRIPAAERFSGAAQSVGTGAGGAVPANSVSAQLDMVSYLARGVGALETIAADVHTLTADLHALVTLLGRECAPIPVFGALARAAQDYWEHKGLIKEKSKEKKVCVRTGERSEETTLTDFLEPVSIEDTARTIAKPYRWVVARLTESKPYEQEFLHWQSRARKGCSSLAAQAILYFALIRPLMSSRLLVERSAEHIFHAPVDEVRRAAASVGLAVIGKGDSYNGAQLKERLVLPVVLYAIAQYQKR